MENNNIIELNLKHASIIITQKCTLKCKLCAVGIPLYQNPQNINFESISKQIKNLFVIINHVEKFSISGGEAFLHEELSKIIDEVMLYRNQFDKLILLTNGTLIPNDQIIDKIKNYRNTISVNISNYGETSYKVKELIKILEDNAITFREIKYYGDEMFCDGWVDFGVDDLYKKRFNTKEEIEALYSKCRLPNVMEFCFASVNGEIFPCSRAKVLVDFSVIPKNKDEYIDLFEDITVEEQRQKFVNILNSKSLTACAYCNGLCEDSKRFPPAEQLE